MGEWSFADMAGHLLGWRNLTLAHLDAAARGEPDLAPPWPLELDDDDSINPWIRAQHAGRAPEELVADYDASYDRLIAILESVPDAMSTEVIPWIGEPLTEVDFTGHLHEEHVRSVRAWLDASAGVR